MSSVTVHESKMFDDEGSAKRGSFALNLITSTTNYGLVTIVGFFFVPYLISNLGVSAFGLIPLATQIATYMLLLTMVLNLSISRYITVAVEQGTILEAKKTFTTSVVAAGAFALIFSPLGIALVINAEKLLRIPAGLESDAKILLALVLGAFLANQILSPFGVSTFCRNRLDIRNAIEILGIAVRVGLVIIAFNVLSPSIRHVGAGILAASLIMGVGAIVSWRLLTPDLRVIRGGFDWTIFKNMTTTGGWIAVNQLGSLLYVGIDLIVVNRLLGPAMGGQYAVVIIWSTFLRGAATAISAVFHPTIIYHYARNEIDQLIGYMQRSIKTVGFLLALPIGLVSGMSRPILQLWVGEDFIHLAPLMTLVTIHLSINLGIYPLFFLQSATNRVKVPGMVTCFMGIGNLLLAILLASKWGMYGVATAGAIMLTGKNLIFTPLYASHILGLGRAAFLRQLIPIITSTLGLSLLSWYASRLLELDSWLRLGTTGIVVAAVYCVFVYQFLLSSEDKRLLAASKAFLMSYRARSRR